MAFHQLQLRLVITVTHLGDESVTVSHHCPEHNALNLVKTETVSDVDTLAFFRKVSLIGFRVFSALRVALHLDAVAHAIKYHVRKDLLEQSAIPFCPSAALDHV